MAKGITLDGTFKKLKSTVLQFVEDYVGYTPINKYHHGRLVFDVGSMFVGVGEASAMLKGMSLVKAAVFLERAAALAERFNVLSKMLSKVGVTVSKLGSKGVEFVIRRADGSIAKVIGKYVDNVLKGVKQKTAAYTKYLGIHTGDIEFADGTKRKGTYKIWGKCGSVSTLRVNTDGANGCGNLSEAAAEAAKGGRMFTSIVINMMRGLG
ncbi:hypothetical protein [Emticicia fluvialis]|uniref:hypothetical protein n=1 Tax=Emticicia fluvialis TaxID=2974474 RepID=UPI0021660F7A|nr:hypothetical protein [Emticicia fluvialis]